MIKRFCLSALVLVSLAAAIIYFSYSSFRKERLGELESGSQLVETSRGPIEYRIIGDSGPYLLYAHGRPGGYDHGLTIPGFRVLVPSRPGYLRTPLSVGRTPEEQAHAYAVLLDSLSIGQVFVLGISGGGPSAISFAALYPQRTVALAAFAAVSQPIEPDEVELAFMKSDFLLWATSATMRNSLLRTLVDLLVRDPETRATIDSAASLMSIWPVSRRQAGNQNDEIQFQTLDLLNGREVTVPTLIIHGTDDANVPFSHSQRLASQIPTAELHSIEGGTHWFLSTHKAEVDKIVMGFIQSVMVAAGGEQG